MICAKRLNAVSIPFRGSSMGAVSANTEETKIKQPYLPKKVGELGKIRPPTAGEAILLVSLESIIKPREGRENEISPLNGHRL